MKAYLNVARLRQITTILLSASARAIGGDEQHHVALTLGQKWTTLAIADYLQPTRDDDDNDARGMQKI